MAIAIGVNSKGTTTGATSVATGAIATQATGSCIVGAMVFQGTFSNYTDSKSNSPYVQVSTEQTVDTANSAKLRMYHFPNAVGGAGHTTTAAVTTSQPITNMVAEITGAALSSVVGTSNGATDTTSPYGNLVTITPTAGNYLLLAAFGGNSGSNPATQAETQGFTILTSTQELNGATLWPGCLAYKLVTADGSTAYTAQFTESGASQGGIILAAFKELSAGGLGSQRGQGPGYGPKAKRILSRSTRSFTSASANLSISIDTAGAITLAGQSTTMGLGVAQSTQGAITIAGQSITPALTIPLTNGAVTIAGQSITFARNVALAQGGITLAGQSITPALTIPLTNGAVTLAGQSLTFAEGLAVSNGLITFAGQSITLANGANLTLDVSPGSITFDGQSVTLLNAGNITLALDNGLITLSGQDTALTLTVPQDTSQTSGGGYAFFNEYDAHRQRKRRRKLEEDEAQREADSIQVELDREIAQLLRAQEARDAERAELARIQALADRFAGTRQPVSRRVSAALLKAHEERTRNALQQLAREIERMIEEEEIAVIHLLLNDD